MNCPLLKRCWRVFTCWTPSRSQRLWRRLSWPRTNSSWAGTERCVSTFVRHPSETTPLTEWRLGATFELPHTKTMTNGLCAISLRARLTVITLWTARYEHAIVASGRHTHRQRQCYGPGVLHVPPGGRAFRDRLSQGLTQDSPRTFKVVDQP